VGVFVEVGAVVVGGLMVVVLDVVDVVIEE